MSAGSSAQAAAEPTISTDSDFLGNLSDTLFSGEDLHMSAWGQRGKAGRKRETVLVVTFVNSWSWTSKKQDLFPYKCTEKGEEEGLELPTSIDW